MHSYYHFGNISAGRSRPVLIVADHAGKVFEWDDIKRDLTALREVEIAMDGDRYFLRTELRGSCFDALQAAVVAAPPTLRR